MLKNKIVQDSTFGTKHHDSPQINGRGSSLTQGGAYTRTSPISTYSKANELTEEDYIGSLF